MASSTSVVLMYFFLKSLSCPALTLRAPQNPWGILPPQVTIRVLLAGVLCSSLGFGHWQVIIFPPVFLLLVWILIFFSQTVSSKVLRGSLDADVQARSPSPSQSQRKCRFLCRLITRDTQLPSAQLCPHLGKQWCPCLGREAWLGCSLCPPWRTLSFLGPELMPVVACTQYSRESSTTMS